MRLGLEGEIEVIVGDGSSDWKRIENALRRHERDYCEVSVFFPKRGKEGKARAQGMATGIKGVFMFLRREIEFQPTNFVVFIDREHVMGSRGRLGSELEKRIVEAAQEFGIQATVTELSEGGLQGLRENGE